MDFRWHKWQFDKELAIKIFHAVAIITTHGNNIQFAVEHIPSNHQYPRVVAKIRKHQSVPLYSRAAPKSTDEQVFAYNYFLITGSHLGIGVEYVSFDLAEWLWLNTTSHNSLIAPPQELTEAIENQIAVCDRAFLISQLKAPIHLDPSSDSEALCDWPSILAQNW